MVSKTVLVVSLVLTLAGAAACGGDVGKDGSEVRVVATIFPVSDMVGQVGGSRVRVTTLLPAGSSPHTFEPTVKEAMEVARADLVIAVGGTLDGWALGLGGEGAPVIELIQHVPGDLLLLDRCGDHAGHHVHPDPHVWLDPVIVGEHLVPAITTVLASVDPGGRETYSENASRFRAELHQLHREIGSLVSALERRAFIACHPAWGYLARRYGLEEVALVEGSPGKEPTARRMAELVDLARELGITVVFTEPQLDPGPAEALAGELGGRVLVLDPLGGEGLPGRDGYIALMRENLDVLAQGLR